MLEVLVFPPPPCCDDLLKLVFRVSVPPLVTSALGVGAV
jgi:hypothetical protein